jgi:3-phosphoglycerate kinase
MACRYSTPVAAVPTLRFLLTAVLFISHMGRSARETLAEMRLDFGRELLRTTLLPVPVSSLNRWAKGETDMPLRRASASMDRFRARRVCT